jgi:hypothetical protein
MLWTALRSPTPSLVCGAKPTAAHVRRDLADILTEVAEGRSTLTYMGG